MRLRSIMLATALLLGLAACSSPANDSPATPTDAATILTPYGLDGLDSRALIDRLDRTPLAERPKTLRASVRPDQLLLSDTATGTQATLPLPEGQFYLSIAAYRSSNHDCFFHSLTTCRGELGGQPVHVTVTDRAGTVLVDRDETTFDNGFLGLWLPAGIAGTLRVDHKGQSATADITTGPDAATCLTTLRLA